MIESEMKVENDPANTLCFHAHKINLPLLANFPAKRIDINPFHTKKEDMPGFDWHERRIDVLECYKIHSKKKNISEVAVFLDSYTINNLYPENLSGLNVPIYLIIGDTQHGPFEGFLNLITLAARPEFKYVLTANNPQHLNLLRISGIPSNKLYYFPLGAANYIDSLENSRRIEGGNEGSLTESLLKYFSKEVIFVGNTSAHPRRREIVGKLSAANLIKRVSTKNYKDMLLLFSACRAALNLSLNGDINFRFFEALRQGCTLITDRLPFIQEEYLKRYTQPAKIIYYSSINDCIDSISKLDYFHIEKQKPELFGVRSIETMGDIFSGHATPFLDHRRKILEDRLKLQYADSIKSKNWEDRLARYIYWRDMALENTNDRLYAVFGRSECPLTAIDCLDLPRFRFRFRFVQSKEVEELFDKYIPSFVP